MITKTSLSNPVFVKKIKEAIILAVRKAHTEPSSMYIVDVFNKKGKVVLTVCGIKNRGFVVRDNEMKDMTVIVKEVLNSYHEAIKSLYEMNLKG